MLFIYNAPSLSLPTYLHPQLKKLYETPKTQQDTWQLSETVHIANNVNFAVILLAKQGSGGDERHIAVDDISFANQCGFGKT